MSFVGKNPKFDSTILKNEGSDPVDNPPVGSNKIFIRNDALYIKNNAGTENFFTKSPINLNSSSTTSVLPVTKGGTGVTGSTGTGTVVLSNSPQLFTPNLGTPSVATLTNATGLPISGGTTGTLPLNRGGTGATTQTAAFDALSPTTTKGDIIADDGTNAVRVAVGADGLILKADSTAAAGISWGTASSGSGEINYIENPDAEANTTGWATYADAAGATPVDGTGGSANVTWTRQASVVLRGNQSFQLSKDAANRQGEGVSYDFSIKGQDVSKKLKIQFDFKTDEIAEYEKGDLIVAIYDVDNSQIITSTDATFISSFYAVPKGQDIFQTYFNATTSLNYRLIFHVADSGSDDWTAYIDNVIVGPGMTSQGAAISDWEQTETLTISGITLSSQAVVQRRVGSSLEMRGQLVYGSGTGDFFISLPSGLTIDTRVLTPANENSQVLGAAQANDSGTFYHGTITPATSTTVRINVITSAGSGSNWSNTVPFTWASGNIITFSLTVPIAEWAGKGIVPMLAQDNLSQWQTEAPTFSGLTTSDTIEWRRVGDSMEVKGTVVPSTVSGAYVLTIPGGNTIADWGGTADVTTYGVVKAIDAGVAHFYGQVVGASATTVSFRSADGNPSWANTFPFTWTSSDTLSFNFTVPITEFAGSQNSLVGYTEASPEYKGLVSMNTDATTSVVGEYAETTVTLDNGITGTAKFVRVGNMVTMTGTGAWTHSSAGNISTTAIVPAAFRPTTTIINVYSVFDGAGPGGIYRVVVESSGDIVLTYYDAANPPVVKAQTSTIIAPSISYVIT